MSRAHSKMVYEPHHTHAEQGITPLNLFFEKGLVITPVFVGQPLDRPPRIARDEMVWTEDFPNPMCGITSAQLHRLIRRIMRSFSAYFDLMTTSDNKFLSLKVGCTVELPIWG